VMNAEPDFGEVPRRVRRDLWTPCEYAIAVAIWMVEEAGTDPRLTDAVILLSRAKDRVSDFVDGVLRDSWEAANESKDGLRPLVAKWRREARVAEREWEASSHPSAAGRYTQLDVCATELESVLAEGAPCVNCDGSGHDPIDENQLCRVCGGTGEIE
jgi:hypothetical protein